MQSTDAAYCYTIMSHVPWRAFIDLLDTPVGLLTAEMVQPAEMPFVMQTHVGPMNHVLDNVYTDAFWYTKPYL